MKLNPPLNKLRLQINGILSFEISASTVCTCTFVPNILISEMIILKFNFVYLVVLMNLKRSVALYLRDILYQF